MMIFVGSQELRGIVCTQLNLHLFLFMFLFFLDGKLFCGRPAINKRVIMSVLAVISEHLNMNRTSYNI